MMERDQFWTNEMTHRIAEISKNTGISYQDLNVLHF